MSKRTGKKKQEETAPTAEAAVEELDDALDALPDGGAEPEHFAEENTLARVDVSGETSFDSAEFEEEDEAEDESDEEESEEESEEDKDDDEADEDDDDTADFVMHDADAED